MKDLWIAGIARGHNAGVCLLKNGEIVFSIEEERLSRKKYDGGPYASMVKILDYTDRLDYLVVAHTSGLNESIRVDFSGDDVYTGLARKLGLIDRSYDGLDHPQVIDLSHMHHQLHVACAFYRSGFKEATGVVADGAGTFIPMNIGGDEIMGWETETIFNCDYENLQPIYKHIGTRGPHPGGTIDDKGCTTVVSDRAGITKTYEAVTQYCGFSAIEAGKTMGLFPYGRKNNEIPPLFEKELTEYPFANRNLIVPTYPNAALVNCQMYKYLKDNSAKDLTTLDNRRDMAYAVQTETQQELLDLILKGVSMTGKKNVVLSGGYALNCVANYYYLQTLKEEGINLYVEPISSDAGTAIGAALITHQSIASEKTEYDRQESLYLGPIQPITQETLNETATKYNATIESKEHSDVIDLITAKNIVAVFQGRSENGPRALGNRSLLFDPTIPDGKDFVNQVKRREYFRPFAGSILEEDVHEWFDLRGMDSSPSMMYAVNCKPGIEEKIPAIIHVDGTCRIQTVNREQNPLYYDIIKTFKDKTGCPIIFNTSFNLGGEPLVETLDDALRTLANSDIEYLYLPEQELLLTVKNNK